MPRKPNYNFEKRQKELAREQKREVKAREKRERKLAENAIRERESPPSPSDTPPAAALEE